MTEEQRQMIADCLRRIGKLNDKEAKFINDLSEQTFITEKQDAWLNSLWDRVTANG